MSACLSGSLKQQTLTFALLSYLIPTTSTSLFSTHSSLIACQPDYLLYRFLKKDSNSALRLVSHLISLRSSSNMNTPYSMAIGWGSLLLAGGGAYYYAKKDINDRRDKDHRKRLAHTSGVAMQRHHAEGAQHDIQGHEIVKEDVSPPRYRLANGNSTEGRDRGDRL